MLVGLTKITFKDKEDKRCNLRKAYNIVESHHKGASVTYIDKGLIVEYIVERGRYK